MKRIVFLVLLFSISVVAQQRFKLDKASKNVDVAIEVKKCDNGFCEGAAKFSFFRKKASKPFQIINLEDTIFPIGDDGNAVANVILLYDEQSAVNFGDFNFDGVEDFAICDGKDSGYGGPSYRVYLYSKQQGKFVLSPLFTALAHGVNLGMFETDRKKRMHYRFSKSGCCWHQTEGFTVINNRPKKIYELTEDAMLGDGNVYITTRKRIRGIWRTWNKRVKQEVYYNSQ